MLNRQIYEINLATLEKNKQLDCLFGSVLNCESHVSAMLVYSDAHTTFPELESVGGCGVQTERIKDVLQLKLFWRT